ncbi:hypothetical protein, partial [Xanthomonas oryzae]|uniref:hypothetical protein n=1 Tax=Xanthomonas oryzae TaxID=347 RepID=UPI0009650FA5
RAQWVIDRDEFLQPLDREQLFAEDVYATQRIGLCRDSGRLRVERYFSSLIGWTVVTCKVSAARQGGCNSHSTVWPAAGQKQRLWSAQRRLREDGAAAYC